MPKGEKRGGNRELGSGRKEVGGVVRIEMNGIKHPIWGVRLWRLHTEANALGYIQVQTIISLSVQIWFC